MKVAYNNCYGGFGLSYKATLAYAKRKGIDLTAYKQTKYKHDGGVEEYKKIANPDGMFVHYSTQDLGDVIGKIPEENYYYESFHDDAKRTDPDLIAVIEEFGSGASGDCADLKIAEIPDGAQYEIDEYDGNESVVPPRQSW